MLGSVTEAEDAVQESWLRLDRAGEDGIDNMRGWLTTVIGRVCIDMLRARKSRQEDFVGDWLPEPVLGASDDAKDPEQRALLADSVGLALLVVLEMLSPAERLAFVLHDMFAVPFDEIAPIVGRSPETARQLASRARRRVRGAPEPDADRDTSVGWSTPSWPPPGPATSPRWWRCSTPTSCSAPTPAGARGIAVAHIEGAEAVARNAVANGSRWARWCHPALVNGQWGCVVVSPRRPIGVAGMTVARGRIASIELILDPAKVPADAAKRAAGAFGMRKFS